MQAIEVRVWDPLIRVVHWLLAAAVLIDATIVRAVLLPASMKLLGDWNWYLPTWLNWLPDLEHGRDVKNVKARPVPTPSA